MFYGWEDFKRDFSGSEALDSSEPLVADPTETVSNLRKQIMSMAVDARLKDASIGKLQRDLESTTAALKSEQAKHAETMARNRELEKELEERILKERGLRKQLDDQGDKHNHEMTVMKTGYLNDIQRLVFALKTLEDAEERLVAQLGGLEAEFMEQNRFFNAESASLSQSLARKEQELSLAQAELELMRQSKLSLKELGTMDLAAQLSKCTHECDKMRLQTELLQGEVEKAKVEAATLQQELALAKLVNSWRSESKTIQEEKYRAPPQLCRSESLSLDTQRRTQHAVISV
uniref:Uncharacterized protein n=1 Tax=Physcomitrium patens TaxID=3218 RepID=A9SQN7_PHYPA|nr:hypothetical protein PHYPA_019714 [Physcomitrium patens]